MRLALANPCGDPTWCAGTLPSTSDQMVSDRDGVYFGKGCECQRCWGSLREGREWPDSEGPKKFSGMMPQGPPPPAQLWAFHICRCRPMASKPSRNILHQFLYCSICILWKSFWHTLGCAIRSRRVLTWPVRSHCVDDLRACPIVQLAANCRRLSVGSGQAVLDKFPRIFVEGL